MDKPASPRDRRDLSLLCDRRARELQTRAWHSDAERDALREATADLLAEVARELDPGASRARTPSDPLALGDDELRTLIATRVVHRPLHPTDCGDAHGSGGADSPATA